MPRKSADNRFKAAGQALVNSGHTDESPEKNTGAKKDKVISAKVYPDTWAEFSSINKALGMTNNSVINMLISEYVKDKK